MGSWPLTSDAESGTWSEASWDMEEAMSKASFYSALPLFVTAVTPDAKNSSNYIITVRAHFTHLFTALSRSYSFS